MCMCGWMDLYRTGHIAGDMCQDLHFVLINTILCFNSGIGCDFLIFEMPFHSICILILHYYLKWAKKSFEKYICLIWEQFVNSTVFCVQELQRSKVLPKVKRWNEYLMWTGRDHEINHPPEQFLHTFSHKCQNHK